MKRRIDKRQAPIKRDGVSPVMLDSTLTTVEHLARQLTDLRHENGRLAAVAGDVDRFLSSSFFLFLSFSLFFLFLFLFPPSK